MSHDYSLLLKKTLLRTTSPALCMICVVYKWPAKTIGEIMCISDAFFYYDSNVDVCGTCLIWCMFHYHSDDHFFKCLVLMFLLQAPVYFHLHVKHRC